MVNRLLEQVEVVQVSESDAELHVPAPYFWDLVECFGENHVEAMYTFTPRYFVAKLRHTSPSKVRQILGDWRVPEVRAALSH